MIRNQKGMTLVEALISGVIGAIIAGMVVVIITLQGSTLNEGTANSQMQRHATAVSDRIGRSVRSGFLVLPAGEPASLYPIWRAVAKVAQVNIVDLSGAVIAAYRANGTILEESNDALTWALFRVAEEPTTLASGGTFIISEDRKTVALNVKITTIYKSKGYTMDLRGDTFRCRQKP